MSKPATWFINENGIVVTQFDEYPNTLEDLLILPFNADCDVEKIKQVNSVADDFLDIYYPSIDYGDDNLLADELFDVYLDVLAEIAEIDPYWFLGLKNRFTGF